MKATIMSRDTNAYYTPKAGDSDSEIKRKRARRDKLEENVMVANLEVAIRSIATDAVLRPARASCSPIDVQATGN